MTSIILIIISLFPLLAAVVETKKFIELGRQHGFYEGDILMPKTRNGILRSKRWTDGIVPYSINMTRFTKNNVDMIEDAMRMIENHTCVRFVNHTDQQNNLVIYNGGGCFSTGLGMQGGTQYVSLNDPGDGGGCFAHHIVIHELLHALGLGHEQCRYDRDQYVKVHLDKLGNDSYSKFQLRILPETESSFYGIPYNYASVMHYDAWSLGDYSAGFFIMEPTDMSMLGVMGFAKQANETDFEKIRRIYECNGQYPVVPPDSTPCEDEWKDCNDNSDLCYKDFWMVQYCRKTCGYCEWGKQMQVTPKPYCEDRRPDCDRFAQDCATKEGKWLERECAYTCGFCDRSKTRTPKPGPVEPTTAGPAPAACEDKAPEDHCRDLLERCADAAMSYWCPNTCKYC